MVDDKKHEVKPSEEKKKVTDVKVCPNRGRQGVHQRVAERYGDS